MQPTPPPVVPSPFLKPLVYLAPLCYMKPATIEDLRSVGLILECPRCRYVSLKNEPTRRSNCPVMPGGVGTPVCNQEIDHMDEWWVSGDYVPPPGGVIPTIPQILATLTRAIGVKVETLADDLGMGRTTLYDAMAGRTLPRRDSLRLLAHVCIENGMLVEAAALKDYWSYVKNRKPRRAFRMEDYNLDPNYMQARLDQIAWERNGAVPRPEFQRPPGS